MISPANLNFKKELWSGYGGHVWQEDYEFDDSLGSIVRACLKNQKVLSKCKNI